MVFRATQTKEERFWSRVKKTDSCWLWTGHITYKGYGQFNLGGHRGKIVHAHRVSWEMHNGPVPEGLMVLHDCPDGDNPRCVNPDHLWIGTAKQNTQDMVAKGRSVAGKKGSRAKWAEDEVREVRRLHGEGMKSSEIAGRFGCSCDSIRDIVNRITYKWVD